MFDYTILHWTTFLMTAVVLNIAPGPDMAFILGQTARGGQRAGFAAMFGVWSGAFLHVLMAAIGLSAVLTASALLFSMVKWIGAIYLIWLGIQALRSNGESFMADADNETQQNMTPIFQQGALVAILNPKTAIFFLAFLPQFIVEGAGATWAQLFLHGSLIIVVAAFIEPPIILLSAKFMNLLKDSQSIGKLLDRGLGILLIGLGIRLLFSKR